MFIVSTVTGSSMAPSIKEGEVHLCDTSIKAKTLQRGDVIAVKIPRKYRTDFKMAIKRVVAVAGDSVFCYDGRLYVNGEIEKRRYVGQTHNVTQQIVPDGCVFVLGDNRENSNDSRVWGPIPYRHVVGKMVRRLNKKNCRKTDKGYKPKSFKESFKMCKREMYRKWNLED